MHTIYEELKNPSALATLFQLHTNRCINKPIKKGKRAINFSYE